MMTGIINENGDASNNYEAMIPSHKLQWTMAMSLHS